MSPTGCPGAAAPRAMIGPVPETPRRMPCGPTRRSVLGVLGLAAAAVPLAACGIRLEDDAPRLPLIPTREPVPGEVFLLGMWLGSTDLAEHASALGGAASALPARLAALHRTQAEVLRTLLRTAGVPDVAVREARQQHEATPPSATRSSSATSPSSPAATGTSGAAPARTTTSPTSEPTTTTTAPSRSTLAASEVASLSAESFAALGALDAETVTAPAAALAQRATAATLLGQAPTWPTQESVSPALAAAALEATRAAAYGLEVVAAQSSGSQRRVATTTLATLRARAARLDSLAGDSAGPPSLGYPLPFPVTGAASARRLAQHVLSGLRAAHAAAPARAAGDPSGLAATVQWLTEAEGLCHRWGLPLEPFPGLD